MKKIKEIITSKIIIIILIISLITLIIVDAITIADRVNNTYLLSFDIRVYLLIFMNTLLGILSAKLIINIGRKW